MYHSKKKKQSETAAQGTKVQKLSYNYTAWRGVAKETEKCVLLSLACLS